MRRPGLWIGAAALVLGVLTVPLFAPGSKPSVPGTDLPWQVETDAHGVPAVFGIRLGETRLQDVLPRLGRSVELGLFRQADGRSVLEAYYREIELGGLTTKLILRLGAGQAALDAMIARAGKGDPTPSGSMQYIPASTDDHAIIALPIIGLTYSPLVRLDEDVIRSRFGEPAEKLAEKDGVHWLYPARSLDLFRQDNGKSILTYLLPADYAQWRAQYRPPSGQ